MAASAAICIPNQNISSLTAWFTRVRMSCCIFMTPRTASQVPALPDYLGSTNASGTVPCKGAVICEVARPSVFTLTPV
tara:strand:+ start:525 stop:758 length:234 start_codon:yes stop_codon:yes gene_type:complete